MKLVINLIAIVSLISLLYLPQSFARCRFIDKKIVSLSGPITQLLKEMDLLNDPMLKAISIYNMIEKKHFNGHFIGGGLLLSPKFLQKLGAGVLFFDESREMKRTLGKIKKIKIVELRSVGDDPFVVYEQSKRILIPYLKGCSLVLKKLDSRISKMKETLSAMRRSKRTNKKIFFYLGKIQNGHRRPNILMNRDGFVLSLINLGIIQSYPSKLKYLPWSEKIVNKFKEKNDLVEIGLVANIKYKKLVMSKETPNLFNVYHPTMLIPGIAQIFFLMEFLPELFAKLKEPIS